jgi:geranylgeranyl reductase
LSHKKDFDVIVVGAGPGGLACATRLARSGVDVLLLERNKRIGVKACAGGITWSGLIQSVPETLIERSFPQQYVTSRLQNICVSAAQPIIATVSREKLGHFMAEQARKAGVTLQTSTSLKLISPEKITVTCHNTGEVSSFSYNYLVGADGSSSTVRRLLGFATSAFGIGITYQISRKHDKMEWDLDSRFFDNGYGWIFPHADSISIGAYLPQKSRNAVQLQKRLHHWAAAKGITLSAKSCSAGLINYDFQGYCFGRYFLVGDAAGCASALTGEGIYPAIISGEAAADKILDPQHESEKIKQLIRRQRRFRAMVNITSKNNLLAQFLAETGVLGLRTGILTFKMLEMSS